MYDKHLHDTNKNPTKIGVLYVIILNVYRVMVSRKIILRTKRNTTLVGINKMYK